jgi:hypothetical protein
MIPDVHTVWLLATATFSWLGSVAYRSIRNTFRASIGEDA